MVINLESLKQQIIGGFIMRDAIVTLPISPIEAPHLGLCVIPFLMSLLGKRWDLEQILALNISGLKYDLSSPQAEKTRIAKSYLAILAQLDLASVILISMACSIILSPMTPQSKYFL